MALVKYFGHVHGILSHLSCSIVRGVASGIEQRVDTSLQELKEQGAVTEACSSQDFPNLMRRESGLFVYDNTKGPNEKIRGVTNLQRNRIGTPGLYAPMLAGALVPFRSGFRGYQYGNPQVLTYSAGWPGQDHYQTFAPSLSDFTGDGKRRLPLFFGYAPGNDTLYVLITPYHHGKELLKRIRKNPPETAVLFGHIFNADIDTSSIRSVLYLMDQPLLYYQTNRKVPLGNGLAGYTMILRMRYTDDEIFTQEQTLQGVERFELNTGTRHSLRKH